jgi:hypothetical protein
MLEESPVEGCVLALPGSCGSGKIFNNLEAVESEFNSRALKAK